MKNLIIAWRFDNKKKGSDLKESGNFRVIPIFTPGPRNYHIKDVEFDILREKIMVYKEEELLVLIHSIQFNKDQKKEINTLSSGRMQEFKRGGKIYDILNFKTSWFNEPLNENTLIEIWEEYSIKKNLIKHKHKVITSWLPLAIDIQGLSEVEKSKRDEYLKDIFESNNNNHNYYKQLLVDFWNMMVEQKFNIDKKAFKKVNDSKNEKSLQSILKNTKKELNDYFYREKDESIDIGFNQDMKSINADSYFVKFINKMDEVCNNIDDIDDLFSNYISKSQRNFFFPLWLQEFAKKLDVIIISI